MDDATRVLVGYATAAGSTTGIAERIAATLRDAGGDVTCRPVGPDLDPAAFDVLVVVEEEDTNHALFILTHPP